MRRSICRLKRSLPTAHEMINRPGVLDAQLSGHAPRLARTSRCGQSDIAFSLTDPSGENGLALHWAVQLTAQGI